MGIAIKNRLLFACVIGVVSLIHHAESLKVMELMAPYKLRSAANGRVLTASQQGILGLKTGTVTTQPYLGRAEQQWQIVWDPSMDDNHDGYRLESRMDYLNQITTYYPDGSTQAMANIWEIIELPNGGRMFRNKRTRRCLQVLKSSPEVVERTCSIQNRFQHWLLELLDLDKKIGERRYQIRAQLPKDLQDQLYDDKDDSASEEDEEEDDDYQE